MGRLIIIEFEELVHRVKIKCKPVSGNGMVVAEAELSPGRWWQFDLAVRDGRIDLERDCNRWGATWQQFMADLYDCGAAFRLV